MLFSRKPLALPDRESALPGRATPIPTASTHFVSGRELDAAAADGRREIVFALGCFWGAERVFLGSRRCVCHAGRLCGRSHAESDL